jgi:hypothetical protein
MRLVYIFTVGLAAVMGSARSASAQSRRHRLQGRHSEILREASCILAFLPGSTICFCGDFIKAV